MPYDPVARALSDRCFYDNIHQITECLSIDANKIKPTSRNVDMTEAIDFICDNVLISHKTIDEDFTTFTFRIPPIGDNEFEKLKMVHDRDVVNGDKKLIVTVINTLHKYIYWCNFDDILLVPDEEIVVRRLRNEPTKMHVIYHDDINKFGGIVNSMKLDCGML